jgi:hypothetical protein
MFAALQYLYLLRFPLICAGLVAAFGPLATGPARALLSGMFDLDTTKVAAAAYTAAWVSAACFFSTQLVLHYGVSRFAAPPLSGWFAKPALPFASRTEALFFLLYVSAALVFCWFLARESGHGFGVLVGLAGFVGTLIMVEYVGNRVPPRFNSTIASCLAFTPSGYVDVEAKTLLPSHGRALAVSLLAHALYAIVGLIKLAAFWWPETSAPGHPPTIPTIVCVLLLIMIVCWNGSALAFFLDRFRIPVLLVVVVLLVVAGQWPQSDHYFPVHSRVAEPIAPREALAAAPGNAAIVVAVSGGGIQASAWAAMVLTGLDQASNGRFAPMVRLVSSVSGGSVGTMHFLGAWRDGTLNRDELRKVFDRATASSLDDVAWGAIYPDLVRLVAPFLQPRRIGRGWALENAWAANQPHLLEPLAAWRPFVAGGKMPAVMFNATIVETGARVVFSTVDAERSGSGRSARTFSELYPGLEVSPVTAARLSATFPYVTPAARPDAELPRSRRLHFVDGGYWDNFGVASAAEFVQQAVGDGSGTVKHILLIEIRDRKTGDAVAGDGSRGGVFQAVAPLAALYNVRDNGQMTRDQAQLDLLAGYVALRGVTLHRATFEYPANAPLSWHLKASEIAAITNAWKAMSSAGTATRGFTETMAFVNRAPQSPAPAAR